MSAVPDDIPTLPELFRDNGYNTAGLSGNPFFGESTDLDRGFDRFANIKANNLHKTVGVRGILKYLVNIRRYGGGFTTAKGAHNRTYFLADIARRWLDDFKASEDPFFMYMHLNSTHYPFAPPKQYANRFLDDDISFTEAKEISFDIFDDVFKVMAEGCELSDKEWRAIKGLYDAEIAFSDEFIGRLFKQAQTAADDLTFIITADHGEHFGEQQMLGHHGSTHDVILNVPLVTYNFPAELGSNNVVEHIDLTKTLAESAGIESTWFEGLNLQSSSREIGHSHLEPATWGRNVNELLDGNTKNGADNSEKGPYTIAWDGEWKLYRNDDSCKLYRLPEESEDISEDNPDIVEELTTNVVAENMAAEDWKQLASSDAFDDGAIQERLSALGYR